MDDMTALAEAFEVSEIIVGRIVVQMGCGQNDAGRPKLIEIGAIWCHALEAMRIAPAVFLSVEPPTVRQA